MGYKIECQRCLLDSEVPAVQIDDDGLCSVCREFDRDWGNWNNLKHARNAEKEHLTMFLSSIYRAMGRLLEYWL